MYTVLVRFYQIWWEKRLVERLKQIEIVVQDSSKSTGISGKMEGENTMEKRLRVFRAQGSRLRVRVSLRNKCLNSIFFFSFVCFFFSFSAF